MAAVSAVAAGLEVWDERASSPGLAHKQTITEPRLQNKLEVEGFRLPPVVPKEAKSPETLVAVRFPTWLQCPECHHIRPARRWNAKPGKACLFCGQCSGRKPGAGASGKEVFVIPVRFVSACEAGHLDDFPWNLWVRHKESCTNRDDLLLKAEGSGLAGLMLSCPKCEASQPMDGIFGKKALAHVSCRGLRPWLRTPDESCGRSLRCLQRGASNLYFPVIHSALDIPPWSDAFQRDLGVHWEELRQADEEDLEVLLKTKKKTVLKHITMSVPEMVAAVLQRKWLLSQAGSNLKDEEYRQFIAPSKPSNVEHSEFELRQEAVPASLRSYFASLTRALRLREVRVISGFTRINPPDSEDPTPEVAPISESKLNWLPAIEVRGEGFFLQFDPDRLHAWEAQNGVRRRAAKIDAAFAQQWKERHGLNGRDPRTITPRFILLHTFAHALIRQTALDSGYSSSSLRERLYADNNMEGVLIYTSTTDSEGTLGGLSRQGVPERIASLVSAAIRNLEWCSSDPICLEGVNSLSQQTNMAACHSCVLVPETSCETFNTLLDRALLIGTRDDAALGFFSGLLSPS
jgi:hypothetical protein